MIKWLLNASWPIKVEYSILAVIMYFMWQNTHWTVALVITYLAFDLLVKEFVLVQYKRAMVDFIHVLDKQINASKKGD